MIFQMFNRLIDRETISISGFWNSRFLRLIVSLWGILQNCEISAETGLIGYQGLDSHFPRFQALLIYQGAESRLVLDWEDLLFLSLSASGVRKEGIRLYQNKVDGFIRELQKDPALQTADPMILGETILQRIHGKLREYKPLQTKLDVLLDGGDYNCVSSALFYMIVARALGLSVYGVGTLEHAFVSLRTADDFFVDVETTNIYGFNPGSKKKFIDSFTSQTGIAYVPRKEYSQRQNLSDKTFVSLILQNRFYILHQKKVPLEELSLKKLNDAISLSADILALTGKESDRNNFNSAVLEYAYKLSKQGETNRALKFLDEVIKGSGGTTLRNGRETLASNQVIGLMQGKQWEQAISLLDNHIRLGYLSAAVERELLEKTLVGRTSEVLRSNVDFEEKRRFLQSVEKRTEFPQKYRAEFYFYLYNEEVSRLQKNNYFLASIKRIQDYPENLREGEGYQKLRGMVQKNYAVSVYNEFVVYFNRKDYNQAEKILYEGLKHIPQNDLLNRWKNRLSQVVKGNAAWPQQTG